MRRSERERPSRSDGGVALQKYDGTQSAMPDARTQPWPMFITGIIICFVGVHLLVVRPMSDRMETVNRELIKVKKNVDSLVGVGDQPWKTNSLLSGLKDQAQKIEE